ncbi:MAG: hypothetical protein SP1CHLAM54_05700 [Chlamydiia bacterium]|nr:hypothetical protein [Chlamydiia bacterium]MCH9615480.1 hypothetical protein [Chlamydiia bacterium]MCH9629135.1 hypothetical protein [Chlamydiia bacterium]
MPLGMVPAFQGGQNTKAWKDHTPSEKVTTVTVVAAIVAAIVFAAIAAMGHAKPGAIVASAAAGAVVAGIVTYAFANVYFHGKPDEEPETTDPE